MTYNTYMENHPLTTYTSPRTGTEYLIVAKPQTRAAYHEQGNPATRYMREYTQYDIVLNGNPVQFCFDEADIASTVEFFENPGRDLGSRFD